LEQLRELMKKPEYVQAEDEGNFYREAETTIDGGEGDTACGRVPGY
jgi:hypothetical protein